MSDLEFYPMTHGDPRSGDWVLMHDKSDLEFCAKFDARHQGFVRMNGYLLDDDDENDIVGWLPIAYWRPVETQPKKGKWLGVSEFGTTFFFHGENASHLAGWMPDLTPPPKQPVAPVNPLANVSHADLIAELQRRMGAK